MNMLAQRRETDEHCTAAPAAKMRHLEFNDVRAGRLVAESIYGYIMVASTHMTKVIVVCREVVEGMPEGHVRRRSVVRLRPASVGGGKASLLLERQSADRPLVTPEDEDEGLVRWFAEQYAAAEGAAAVPFNDADDEPETEADAMLTLSSSSRLARSWRGGGTMRHR